MRIVPARVCGHCGRPLSREFVEPSQQSAGVCILCQERDRRREEYTGARWDALIFYWFAAAAFSIVIWYYALKGFGIL